MNVDGDRDKDLWELNHCVLGECEKVGDGVVGGGQGSSEEDVLRLNRIDEDVKGGCDGAVQAEAVLQVQQQRTQGSAVCWERFLHVRSLKVLLVESDDSTRHVVTALLHNCSYEVIEAANELQAWKILGDLTNHIDLVLAEVVMPCLPGIGLLCKIMSHKTRKNIPVIMMSSHDSMGLVFKCLSKGAADFLLKPIRKNELKNLWQHVWRRCHSSSSSGSESGTQTQKSVKSKSFEKYDNSGSNDEDDNGSIGLNVGDGSDNGSGTQSSWTKQAVEVDSPQPLSPWVQIAECPDTDSTCAQVVHSNTKAFGNKWVPMTATRDCQEQEEQLDNVAMGKDLEMGVPRNQDLQLECPIEVPIKLIGKMKINLPNIDSNKFSEQIDKGQLDLSCEDPSSKLKHEVAKLIGVITNTTELQMESRESKAPNELSKNPEINGKTINSIKEEPSFELSLKRLRGVKDVRTTVQDDRNVLRRMNLSAFTRCNTASNANKAPSGNIGSGCPLDNSSEVLKKESMFYIRSHSDGDPPNKCSNEESTNFDMGSTANNIFTQPVFAKKKSVATSTVKCLHPSAFQPMKNDLICVSQQAVLDKADDLAAVTMLAQPRDTHQKLQIQHLHHHYRRQHHLVYSMQQQQPWPNHDDLSLKKMAETAPHCGSSNVLGGPIVGNIGNCSLNKSASGSNQGSNGQNRSSTAVNAGGMNMGSDYGLAGKSGSGEASGSGSGNRVVQNSFAQRGTALTKFHQKRKERCFRKKV